MFENFQSTTVRCRYQCQNCHQKTIRTHTMKFAGPSQDLLISERARMRLGALLGRVMFHEDSSTPKHLCEKDHGHFPFSPLPLFMTCATVPYRCPTAICAFPATASQISLPSLNPTGSELGDSWAGLANPSSGLMMLVPYGTRFSWLSITCTFDAFFLSANLGVFWLFLMASCKTTSDISF